MRRIHFFEIEDQQWFPGFLRDYMTDFLQMVTRKFRFYDGVQDLITEAIKAGDGRVIDLASGGGGAWRSIVEHAEKEVPNLKITLTDYYPNIDAFKLTAADKPGRFDFISEPVNALNVPHELKGLRTMFLSFHHFRPDEARQILQNAVDQRQPIAVFEGQDRTVSDLIRNSFSWLMVLFLTPFIRPFRWKRILFTYLIPILPVFVAFDGVVSVLRTYRVDEMKAMAKGLQDSELYTWSIGENTNNQIKILYLIGTVRP